MNVNLTLKSINRWRELEREALRAGAETLIEDLEVIADPGCPPALSVTAEQSLSILRMLRGPEEEWRQRVPHETRSLVHAAMRPLLDYARRIAPAEEAPFRRLALDALRWTAEKTGPFSAIQKGGLELAVWFPPDLQMLYSPEGILAWMNRMGVGYGAMENRVRELFHAPAAGGPLIVAAGRPPAPAAVGRFSGGIDWKEPGPRGVSAAFVREGQTIFGKAGGGSGAEGIDIFGEPLRPRADAGAP